MKRFVLFPALLLMGSLLAADDYVGKAAAPSNIVLEVNGAKITLGEVERKHYGSIFQATNSFYQAERSAIEAYVDEYILEQQAKKEGLTVEQLMDKHVNSKIPPTPSEEALKLFFEGMDSKLTYEEMRQPIIDHVKQARVTKIKNEYMASLKKDAKIAIKLDPPRMNVSLKDTPVLGGNAPVTIVEYADYECPYCQQAQPVLDKITTEYKGKVALAYKDVPLPMHSHAQKAAEAARCAGEQGKYWEFHDALFANRKLEVPQLKETASSLKLDAKKFDICLDTGATASQVKATQDEGQSLQIEGTPSFVINGRFFKGGMSYEQLKAVVDEELASSSKKPLAAQK